MTFIFFVYFLYVSNSGVYVGNLGVVSAFSRFYVGKMSAKKTPDIAGYMAFFGVK
jgi:hypothetical protein